MGPATGATACQPCPAGRYQHIMGQSECDAANNGSYAESGATQKTDCPAGTYCSYGTIENGCSSCAKCPAGKFSWKGHKKCTDCPAGSYSERTGQSTCTNCTTGF